LKDTKAYWRSVRKLASELDPETAELDAREPEPSERTHLDHSAKEIWLVSIANENIGTTAGRVATCHPMNAAKMLKDQTHVLATPEQITARKAELAAAKSVIEREEADRKGVTPSKLIEQLTAAVSAGQQPQRGSKPAAEK
jgi:hypothetical protein